MYNIEFSSKAAKSYLKLPRKLHERIDKKLEIIARSPYDKHNNVTSLKGMSSCYRLRVGDWRVVYEIVQKQIKIYVVKIAQRKEVYE